MDRRLLLAIGLMLIVIVLPTLIWPPPPRPEPGVTEPGVTEPETTGTPQLVDSGPSVPVEPPAVVAVVPAPPPEPVGPAPESYVSVQSQLYDYVFSTRGLRLVSATLKPYQSFAVNDSGPAQLIPELSHFFEYALVFGNDTLPLADWDFQPSDSSLRVTDTAGQLEWVGRRGQATVTIRQTFHPNHYVFDVEGSFTGTAAEAGLVVVRMGPRFRLIEADSVWDFRNYAVVTKAGSPERTTFGSLDPGEQASLAGPFEWVAFKSRYFMLALLTIEEGQPRIGGALAVGGPKPGRHATDADLWVSLPAPGGRFGYSVYLGPQEYRRLARMGHDLQNVNPYGWIFQPIIRPVANFIVLILLWMHETLELGYGWVLVLFGVLVRLVLWPLNQKAMRSSMAMQAIQPEIKAVQERYKQDPQRLQQEMMKLYKEHGVNPLGGCLPMLIPMPVLFALFFVFRETIEFRGVPFLWLPDLSRADPLYIIPVVMGLSMFAVSKLAQMGVPPNPQAKMMLYFMPIMLTVLFFNFASGLNLYYAVSNIASVPQQWMIARERLRKKGKLPRAKPG